MRACGAAHRDRRGTESRVQGHGRPDYRRLLDRTPIFYLDFRVDFEIVKGEGRFRVAIGGVGPGELGERASRDAARGWPLPSSEDGSSTQRLRSTRLD